MLNVSENISFCLLKIVFLRSLFLVIVFSFLISIPVLAQSLEPPSPQSQNLLALSISLQSLNDLLAKFIALFSSEQARAAQTVRHNYTIQSCYGGTNANNTCTSDTDCTGGGTCLAPVVAWWNLDESSGTRAATGGSCGADCNLNDINTVTQDTTNKMEGGGAASFSIANGEYLECSDATCGGIGKLDFNSNLTLACWARRTSGGGVRNIFQKLSGSPSNGYRFQLLSGGQLQYGLYNAGSGCSTNGPSSAPVDTWHHWGIVFNDIARTVQMYFDGKTEGSAQACPTGIGDSPRNFSISQSGTSQSMDGQLDECFVANQAYTNQQVCEICRFGLDGEESDRGAQCGSCDPGPAVSPPSSDTTPPILSNGSPTSQLPADTTQTTMQVTTDENATCRYSTTVNTAFGSMTNTFSTTGGVSHSVNIAGLTNGSSYTYYTRCQDAASTPNANTDDYPISFSVASPLSSDTTPPTVSIITPTNNSTVSGNTTVTANASDPIVTGQTTSGVAGVTFFYDLVNQIADVLTAPFTTMWNTSAITNGLHDLIARARDAAGNTATSSSISVTVNNGPPPVGNVYYVDPANGNDTNDGKSQSTAWKTIPGTWKRDGTDYLNTAWGAITKTNKLQPGDTVYLKGGEVQAEGAIWTCSGTESPRRCTGPVSNPIGFYEHGTASNPIRIMVHPTWGAGDFTFSFSNASVNPFPGTYLFYVRTDYLWLEGANSNRRIKLSNCDAGPTYSLLGFAGRRDTNQLIRGSVARYLDVDGSQNNAACHGIDFSTASNYILADSITHDHTTNWTSGNPDCVTSGGFNDNPTNYGMIVDTEAYGCSDGFGSFAAANLKYLRVKSHDNVSVVSKRGFNAGGIDGDATSNVSFFDSIGYNNGNYAFGFSACGDSEFDCTPVKVRLVLVNFIGYSIPGGPAKDTALLYSGAHGLLYNSVLYNGGQSTIMLQSTHRRGTCSGCNAGNNGCLWAGNCVTNQDCQSHFPSDPTRWTCDTTDTLGPTKLTARNTIFYTNGSSATQCIGASAPGVSDNNPIDTDSNFNIWVPKDGGSDANIYSNHTASGGCDAPATTYLAPPDWKGSNDRIGVANRPIFVSADHTAYANNDFRLQAGSPGIDQGDWYCKITSASGSGTTFSTDCDPKEFFYDKDDYPGDFLAEDTAYIGIGTNNVCTIAGLTRSGAPGTPGTITCASPITWTQGEGVSRKPVYGVAPDIGAFEYGTTVPPPTSFDFSLSNSGNLSVSQGGSTQTTITATLTTGTPASLTFSASGLPSGATASFSPVSCSPNCSTTLTITTPASTPLGNSTITVTAIGGGTTKTTSFTLTISDTTFPAITFSSVSSVTQTSATISFTTDELATNQIEYGFTPSYGASTPLATSYVTNHSITLSNLSASTTFNYRIHAFDSAGNETIGINRSFTTLPSVTPDTTPPSAITNLAASQISQTSADIPWTSPGDNGIEGTSASYDLRYSTSAITDANFNSTTQATGLPTPKLAGSSEVYVLAGLSPATTYFVAIQSTDSAGNTSLLSNIATFTTLAVTQPPPPPVPPPSGGGGGGGGGGSGGGGGGYFDDTIPPSVPSNATTTSLNNQITLRWKNPPDTDFVRVAIVRNASSSPTSKTDGTLIYEGSKEEFSDIDLDNTKTYHYAIYAYDKKPNYSSPAMLSAQPQAGVETTSITVPVPPPFRQDQGKQPCIPQTIPGLTLTRSLALGSTGADIKLLQQYLNTNGFIIAQSGPGSPGNESTYFGSLTVKAVQRFQAQNGIVTSGSSETTGYGAVGPKTRGVFAKSTMKTSCDVSVLPKPKVTTAISLFGPFSVGITSPQVTLLQQLLAKDPNIYPEGLMTGFYGSLTVKAVQRFQTKYNILTSGSPETTGYGLAGPRTRERITEILGR